MHEFILRYGYLALFLGSVLEGESVLIAAGFLPLAEGVGIHVESSVGSRQLAARSVGLKTANCKLTTKD